MKHLECSPDALSRDEREAGLVLACRCIPTSDVELAWLATDAEAPQSGAARVVAIDRVTHDITRVKLKLDRAPLLFKAGQYAMLQIGSLPPRAYSMANDPEDPLLEFHIRHAPDGLVSDHVARFLTIGDSVIVDGPHGNAYFRAESARPVLLVGGGSGLAPMLSILSGVLREPGDRPIRLYHGVRDTRDVYATDLLQEMGAAQRFAYDPVLSAPSAATAMRTGFVHEAIEQDCASLAGHVIYTAGPPPMVDAVRTTAIRLGAQATDIHADPFHSCRPAAATRVPRIGLARLLGRMLRKEAAAVP